MSHTPDTISNHAGDLYRLALYWAALSANVHPQVVRDAVKDGSLPVVTIDDCEYVTLADLVKVGRGAQ
jgi:hypothetical protein